MQCRSRHSARSVRAVMPLSSGWRCSSEERVEHRRGPLLEQVARRARRAARRPRWKSSSIGTGSRGRRKQPRVQVLQQDRVDLAHELRGAVVALHQLLARALGAACRRGRAAARARPAGRTRAGPRAGRAGSAGARACAPIKRSWRDDGARLADRHEAVARELAPGAAEARGARDPQHRLQVAQAARALLDVGLEVVRRVLVLEVPLLLLERLRLVERAHVHALVEAAPELRGTARARRRASGARAGSCGP